MDELWDILEKLAAVLEEAIPLEETKLQAIREHHLTLLDDCMTREQALMMKIRGLDRDRESALKKQGMEGVGLRQIVERLPREEQADALKTAERFRHAVSDFQTINEEAMKLAQVYLHRIEGAKQSIYRKDNSEGREYARMTDQRV